MLLILMLGHPQCPEFSISYTMWDAACEERWMWEKVIYVLPLKHIEIHIELP